MKNMNNLLKIYFKI